MKYYEIVRLDNQGFDQECFEHVKKLVRRGWKRKAVEYLKQWDYGGENIGPAQYNDRVWDTPSDNRERTDKVIYQIDGYYLCAANPNVNGGYEAYYLTAKLPEEDV